MSAKNKKQFGIWMDSHHATIVGREDVAATDFTVIATEKYTPQGSNSNENAGNNAERTLQQKFFKQISTHLLNAEELHVTGTGTVQEHFLHFLAEQAQFKNTVTNDATSNKMSDEKLVEYITAHFN